MKSAFGRVVVRGAESLRKALGRKPRNGRLTLAVLIGIATPIAMVAACGEDRVRTPIVGGGNFAGGPGIPDQCAAPNEGCECPTEGEQVDCGRIREQFDDYVTCQMGTRTCVDGAWSACVGDRVTVKSTGTPGLGAQGLGMGQVCWKDAGADGGPDIDPCDPYCNVFPDTPQGVDAGPGFITTDAGITVMPMGDGGVPCTTLTLTVDPMTVNPSGNVVTVTAFGPPLVTTPAGPVKFTLTAGPMGCTTPSPFTTLWTNNQPDRAQSGGNTNTNGTLTIGVPIAGTIRVTAYALGTSAFVDIALKVNVVEAPTADVGGTAPQYKATSGIVNGANGFGNCWPMMSTCWSAPNAGSGSSTVTWLYPYAATYFPLGLQPPDVQYKYSAAAGGNPATKVSLRFPAGSTPTASTFNYSLIVAETNARQRAAKPVGAAMAAAPDPQVVIPPIAWRYFELTARGTDASLAIQRHKGATGSGQLEPETLRNVHFADGQLKGTVYYNSYNSVVGGSTSTNVFGAVLKIGPGDTAPTRALPYDATGAAGLETNGVCTVCHTVSAQGNRLLTMSGYTNGPGCNNSVVNGSSYRGNSCSFSMPTPGWLATYANGTGDKYKFNFGAPYPDGSFYLTNAWDNTESFASASGLFQTSNAAALTSTGAPTVAVTPVFSPDGRYLAFNDGTDFEISEISPCRQFDSGAGEAIEVRNMSLASVDITGWTIRNSGGTTCFTYPATTTLASGTVRRDEWTTACLGNTADTARLYDAAGTQRFSYVYATASCAGTTYQRAIRDCAGAWTSQTWTGTGAVNTTTNDTCTITASADVSGPLLKQRAFSCGAATGSVTCSAAAKTFTTEQTLVDCGSAGCVTAGNPSYYPDSSATIYQHVVRGAYTSAKHDGPAGVVSRLNTWQGALAEIWISKPGATPQRLNLLNGLSGAGTNYLPEIPRDVSTPTNFNNNYHSATGALTTGWVYDSCGGSSTTTTSNSLIVQTTDENQLNYIPTVSPQEAGNQYWVIFTSRRMYGNIAIGSPWQAERSDDSANRFGPFTSGGDCSPHNAYGPGSGLIESKKLWIAAVEKNWTPGTDPSHPAFYLAGQELEAGNSHGYWVSTPCGAVNATCETDDDCCGGTGTMPTNECRITSSSPLTRKCQAKTDCAMIGGACNATTPCCSGMCPTGGGFCFMPPVIPPTTFTNQSTSREFIAMCPHGTQTRWRSFEWQATVPTGTTIDFSVQVKPNAAATYAPAMPLFMSQATPMYGTGPGTWYRGGSTVEQVLAAAATPVASGDYLKVTMTFNVTASAAPTLIQWRQIYDCVPAE